MKPFPIAADYLEKFDDYRQLIHQFLFAQIRIRTDEGKVEKLFAIALKSEVNEEALLKAVQKRKIGGLRFAWQYYRHDKKSVPPNLLSVFGAVVGIWMGVITFDFISSQ